MSSATSASTWQRNGWFWRPRWQRSDVASTGRPEPATDAAAAVCNPPAWGDQMSVTFLASGAFDAPGFLRQSRFPVIAAWAEGDARPTGVLDRPGFSVAVHSGGSEG